VPNSEVYLAVIENRLIAMPLRRFRNTTPKNVNVPSNVGTPTTTKFLENIGRVGVNYRF